MSATPRVGTPYQAVANVNTFTVTLPSGIPTGAGLLLVMAESSGSVTVSSITGLAGTAPSAATGSPAAQSGHSSLIYKRVNLQSSDSGAVLTVNLSGFARITCLPVVLDDADVSAFLDAIATPFISAVASTNITTPTVASVGAGCYEVGVVVNTTGATAQSTVWTSDDAAMVKDGQAFTGGGGTNPASLAVGHAGTPRPAGSTMGGRAWHSDSSGSRSAWTFSIKATNQPPTANAGVAQSVGAGGTITLAGADDDSDGTVAVREWTVISSPGTAPALATPTLQSTNVTLTNPGIYQFAYRVQDNSGAWSAYSYVYAYATSTTPRPMATLVAGGWTAVGAASLDAALADENPATYAESVPNPSGNSFTVQDQPWAPGQQAWNEDLSVSDTTVPITTLVELLCGTTVVDSFTTVPTASVVRTTRTLTPTQRALITNPLDMRRRYTGTV